MSEQRRSRQELRQGLHQFVMLMYQSYLESQTEDEAKSLVADAIKEQLRLFMGSTSSGETEELVQKKLGELDKELKGAESYDEQMYFAEKIDTLQQALEILGLK